MGDGPKDHAEWPEDAKAGKESQGPHRLYEAGEASIEDAIRRRSFLSIETLRSGVLLLICGG